MAVNRRARVNRKDTAKSRARKTRRIRRIRRDALYVLISRDGNTLRGRVLLREGTLVLLRLV